MIGDNYECDGQMEITDYLKVHPGNKVLGEIKLGDCNHEYLPLRNGRKKYYKCVKCGKRVKNDKKMFGMWNRV